MAPLTTEAIIHDSEVPYIPEDILDRMILPRLPFKTLVRFQCICKRFRSLIAHDILFPSEQAQLLRPSFSVLTQFSNNGLSFPTNREFVGLPDPSLKFLGDVQSGALLCSTNGLLLFSRSGNWLVELYLCNPATQEKVSVPIPPICDRWNQMGLAFDPSISPNRYKLVSLCSRVDTMGRNYYQFVVFRSDTGEWSLSKEKVYLGRFVMLYYRKTVYTEGVMYWHFGDHILWYNTEKDLSGSVLLPRGYWFVNVYAGWVVCCRSTDSGLEVWRLTNGTQLDRLHFFSWDCIGLPVDLYYIRRSCVEDVKEFDCTPPFNPQNWLRSLFPLAFDGQFIYLLDKLQSGPDNDILWGYNICTQQLEKKGAMLFNERGIKLFDYHNSMAPIPKILEHATN